VKIRYTLPALADLSATLDYIAVQSPQGARRVHARIQKIIELIALHPHIGVRTDDRSIRRVVATPYPFLIFYEVNDVEVIIHAVRHAARDPSSMPGSA
jgi:toxin ParE1/3/4